MWKRIWGSKIPWVVGTDIALIIVVYVYSLFSRTAEIGFWDEVKFFTICGVAFLPILWFFFHFIDRVLGKEVKS